MAALRPKRKIPLAKEDESNKRERSTTAGSETKQSDAPVWDCSNCGRATPLASFICINPSCGWTKSASDAKEASERDDKDPDENAIASAKAASLKSIMSPTSSSSSSSSSSLNYSPPSFGAVHSASSSGSPQAVNAGTLAMVPTTISSPSANPAKKKSKGLIGRAQGNIGNTGTLVATIQCCVAPKIVGSNSVLIAFVLNDSKQNPVILEGSKEAWLASQCKVDELKAGMVIKCENLVSSSAPMPQRIAPQSMIKYSLAPSSVISIGDQSLRRMLEMKSYIREISSLDARESYAVSVVGLVVNVVPSSTGLLVTIQKDGVQVNCQLNSLAPSETELLEGYDEKEIVLHCICFAPKKNDGNSIVLRMGMTGLVAINPLYIEPDSITKGECRRNLSAPVAPPMKLSELATSGPGLYEVATLTITAIGQRAARHVCPMQGCNQTVAGDPPYNCQKGHQTQASRQVWWGGLHVTSPEGSDSWVNFGDEVGNLLFGISAREYLKMTDTDQDAMRSDAVQKAIVITAVVKKDRFGLIMVYIHPN